MANAQPNLAFGLVTRRNGRCTTQPRFRSRDPPWPTSLRTVHANSSLPTGCSPLLLFLLSISKTIIIIVVVLFLVCFFFLSFIVTVIIVVSSLIICSGQQIKSRGKLCNNNRFFNGTIQNDGQNFRGTPLFQAANRRLFYTIKEMKPLSFRPLSLNSIMEREHWCWHVTLSMVRSYFQYAEDVDATRMKE